MIAPEQAAGPLQAHTLAVNEAAIALRHAPRASAATSAARFAWRHEIAHPLGPPPGRAATPSN